MQRLACRLAVVLLLAGTAAASRLQPQAGGPAGLPAPLPVPVAAPVAAQAAMSDELRSARDVVERGDDDITRVLLAAKTLLDAGDLSTLRLVLTGSATRPLAGLLRALEKLPAASIEPLLPEILGAAAHQADAAVRAQAQSDLRYLATRRQGAVEACIGWLADPALDAASRSAVIDALGESRNVVAVEPLIRALDGPQAADARAALIRLTAHDLGPRAGGAEWRDFWEQHRDLPRDVLVERAMERSKHAYEQQLQEMAAEVVRSRIERMDDDIDKLVAGLSDEYPEVRLQAARRLGVHKNRVGASAAVPVLLRRLGHAISGNGGSFGGEPAGSAPGTGSGTGTGAGTAAVEPARSGSAAKAAGAEAPLTLEGDPGVRAQFVVTAGVLGRARDDVRLALLAELQTSPYAVVTEAAAVALCALRDQPSVVVPLLDHLERFPGEDNAIAVLQAVAANRPVGVIPRLAALAAPGERPRVRAAAVRALMASENTELALDRLQQIFLNDTSTDVHFALAVALGDRVRTLGPDADVRSRVVALLGALLDDLEPSVRVEAAAALGKSGANTALTLLEQRAVAETEASVVVAIVQALGALRLPEAAPAVGRIVAQRRTPPVEGLEAAAQASLSALGEARTGEQWLALAESLERDGAPALAAWCYAELIRLFEPQPADRDTVARARAGRVRALVASGQAEAALRLIEQLAADGASYPTLAERLELQARACETLGRHGDAADAWGARFALLPEGESSRAATQRAWAAALHRAGRNAEALKQFRELVGAEPANNALLWELARVEEQLGQYAQAQADLDRLLGRLPASDAELRVEVQVALDRVTAVLAGSPPGAPPPLPVDAPQGAAPALPSGAKPAEGDAGAPVPGDEAS
jgi:tetratricopeptide (TPR) repeat protein